MAKVGETLTRNANEKDIVIDDWGKFIAKTARPPRKSGSAILQLNNLSVASAAQRHALKNISLQVKNMKFWELLAFPVMAKKR